jgi:hypothetical protein
MHIMLDVGRSSGSRAWFTVFCVNESFQGSSDSEWNSRLKEAGVLTCAAQLLYLARR